MCDNQEKTIDKDELEKVNGGIDLGTILGTVSKIQPPVATVVDKVPKGGDQYLN